MEQISPDLADILTMNSDKVLEILTKPLPNGKNLKGQSYFKKKNRKRCGR